MKKIIVIVMAIFMLMAGITGCASKSSDKNTASISTSEISDEIKKAADISDMKTADASKLRKLYGINSDELDNFVLYTAPTNIRADEIAILKVKESGNVDSIKDKISKRIDDKSQSFKNYLPLQYSLIEKHVLKSKGNFIIFVVSKDSDKIEDAFDKAVK